jgi:hypothetical protein
MPSPKATPIILSDRQQTLLKQIVRQTTNPHRLVRRAQLVLAVAWLSQQYSDKSSVAIRQGSSAFMATQMVIGGYPTGWSWNRRSEWHTIKGANHFSVMRSLTSWNSKFLQHWTGSANCCHEERNSTSIWASRESLDSNRVSHWSGQTWHCQKDFAPKCGTFFKKKQLYSLIATVIGSTLTLMTQFNLNSRWVISVSYTNRL